MSFSTDWNMVSLKGKFGKRILIEKNAGNNCLMIWGRHIEREDVVKFTAWLLLRFDIKPEELLNVSSDVDQDSARIRMNDETYKPKPLPVKSSFAVFLADYKARMNQ